MTHIPTTPAVRRFNAAVERADYLLNFKGDRLSASDLVLALMNRNFWLAECGRAALELEAASKELNFLPTTGGVTERTNEDES